MKIQDINYGDIHVERGDRQRRDAESNLNDLARSIQDNGLINPLIVQETPDAAKSYTLVAGERRFNAIRDLRLSGSEDWTTVPCRVLDTTVDIANAAVIELHENIYREEINWKEEYHATLALLAQYKDKDQQTQAKLIGVTPDKIMRTKRLKWFLEQPEKDEDRDPNKRFTTTVLKKDKTTAWDKGSLTGASNIAIDRWEKVQKRIDEEDAEKIDVATQNFELEEKHKADTAAAVAKGEAPPPPPKRKTVTPRVEKAKILHTSFQEWAESYDGPPFDFIHCDFPYGIKVGRGYDDNERDYKDPMECLAKHAGKLFAEKSHIICWHSSKYRDWTLELFKSINVEWDKHYPDLVWHKGKGQGGNESFPTHSYEVAFFGCKGKRRVSLKQVNNSCDKTSTPPIGSHPSRKCPEMLHYFFEATVDGETRVLDPTCGGGTAIQAALKRGARYVLGIEMDEAYYKHAQAELDKFLEKPQPKDVDPNDL